MEQAIRSCGHSQAVPSNMGRGQARQKRIAVWASLKCDSCHHDSLVAFAKRLTRLDGQRYTDEEQAAYVAKNARR